MIDPKTGEETVEAPTTEVPPSESSEEAVDQQQPDEQESPEAETGENEVGDGSTEEEKPPKDNAAWAKMRAENKRLKEAIGSTDPEYLKSLQGAVGPEEYNPQNIPQVTGDADYNQVTQGVNYANSQAAIARQEAAKLRRQIELQQDREAERAFPALKTDKVFQQIVAEKKLAARVLGHDRTTYEIADEVSNLLNKQSEQVAAKTAQQTKEQILQRQAISSEPKGQTTGGRSSKTDEDLRQRVRKGDSGAETEMAKGLIADLEF